MVIETAIAAVAEVAAESIAEAAVEEAAEATVGEISRATNLSETLSAIQKEVPREIINERNDTLLQNEAFRTEIASEVSQNEAKVSQVEANRIAGAEREKVVYGELADEYPAENGNHIEEQCPLRDEGGKAVKDPETGKGRIVDAVVIKDGEVIKSVEVTSQTADKTAQMAKENRIRDAGGNYIVDRSNGKIVPFAHGVETKIERRP